MSDLTDLLEGESPEIVPTTRIEKYLAAAIDGSGIEGLPAPVSNVDYLLLQLINVLSGGGGASGGLKCLQHATENNIGLTYDSETKLLKIPVPFLIPETWRQIIVQFKYNAISPSKEYPNLTFTFTNGKHKECVVVSNYVGYIFDIYSLPSADDSNLTLEFKYGGDLGSDQSRIFVDYSIPTDTSSNAGYTVTVFYED